MSGKWGGRSAVIAGAVGLVAGIVVGTMMARGADPDTDVDDATADAYATCAILERTPRIDDDVMQADDAIAWRWGAAWSLAAAAAAADDQYEPLAVAVQDAQTSQQQDATEAEQFAAAISSAREFCRDHLDLG